MNLSVHHVRAFLNSDAALEVRKMTSSCDGCYELIPGSAEVTPC